MTLDALNARLNSAGFQPADDSTLTRALYSTDASLYRVPPLAVAVPRTRDELEAVVDAARRAGVPLTTRGAGTSCAGNAVGPGLVVDVGRHLNRIHRLDADARCAVIDPGVIQTDLTAAALPQGLRFGPDPSTANRCTVGGMIGNNACGPRALGYGRSSDNVIALEIITGTGERLTLDSREDARASDSPSLQALARLVDANAELIRREFGHFSRQVSGYSLEWLLPERGFDVAKFFAGSEGTLGVITRATVRLVADDPHKIMLALGYPTMPDAADAMPAILPFSPTAVEGLDSRIVDVVRTKLGEAAVPHLPQGQGWIFVELTDTDAATLRRRADELLAASGCLDGFVVTDPHITQALWQIRSDGAGLAGVSLDAPAYGGWEDAAVPPARLGDYLRDFDALLTRHGLHGLPYGHFGDGCVHCRIDFPLMSAGGAQAYRAFIEEAADLAASYGGSMSGEHGDGRARSALLPRMYSPEALALFGEVKRIFDPGNLLNPGVLVDPSPLDADLRAPQVRRSPLFTRDPQFVEDVHRCTGVGKCVASSRAGDVMCPSFQATRDEKDSTRGRAHVLQEMINGTLVTGGWRAKEVHEALDLCLSCKGCSRDCPTGTDMAAYKSRVLYEAYKRRIRPMNHYALGLLPTWGRLVQAVPGLPALANVVLASPLSGLVKGLAGLDQQRQGMPRFAAGSNIAKVSDALAAGERPALTQPRQAQAGRPGTRASAAVTRLAGAGAGVGGQIREAAGGLRGRLARRPVQGATEPAASAPTRNAPEPTTHQAARSATTKPAKPVLIWVDSFNDAFESDQVAATAAVLIDAGYTPQLQERKACCGLTWISTGQLDGAVKELKNAVEGLYPYVQRGVPIVGTEPSCLSVWRSDALDLVDDPRVREIADHTFTLAELLARDPDFRMPSLAGHTIVAQPHCHQASVIGWEAEAALLKRAGASVVKVGGCCGLAGNFGMEAGHYETSVKVAENELLPAIRAAGPDAILLADGFSCRTQIHDLASREAMTLAQLIASHTPLEEGDHR